MPHTRPLRRGTCLAALMLLLAASSPAAPGAVPGELIVKYRPGADAARRAAALAALPAGLELEPLDLIGGARVAFTGITTDEAIARLAADPRVEYAQPNHVVTIDVLPNDPQLGQLWGLVNTGQGGAFAGDDIDAQHAWDIFTGDPQLKVAVLDSGVDYTHPDLAGNIWTNPGEIPGNAIDDDGNGYVDDVHGYDVLNHDGDPMDDAFHGTHVAGTIGAVGNDGAGIVGVNWHCSIVAIKFIDPTGFGSEADAIAGLGYALAAGAKVVNNSWGNMSGGQALLDAINACGAAGMLLVFSAGNNGWNLDAIPYYPPWYLAPCMINVAATDGRDLRPTWSNYGSNIVHLGAPGAAVYSCKPGNAYQSLNGTSMAAPHVSGVLALAMGRFPHASSERIRQLLLDSTEPVASMSGRTLTGGRLNAYLTLANGDTTAPASIQDLGAGTVDSTFVSLHWTATGDDGLSGTATQYELRWSTAPIDAANFEAATAAPAPVPASTGSPEVATVSGLAPGTTCWFAIRAIDDFGNAGAISNGVTVTTTSAGTGVGGPAGACDALRLDAANPGRGGMRFVLGLAGPGAVTAEIFEPSGRRVTALVNGTVAAGEHGWVWDGRTAAGDAAGPGLYFIRVRTPRGDLVRRFSLVR